MSNDNHKNNYRFNIAKECKLCGKSFITDIFEEADICSNCESVYSYSESTDTSSDYLDDLVTQGWSRTIVYRYE